MVGGSWLVSTWAQADENKWKQNLTRKTKAHKETRHNIKTKLNRIQTSKQNHDRIKSVPIFAMCVHSFKILFQPIPLTWPRWRRKLWLHVWVSCIQQAFTLHLTINKIKYPSWLLLVKGQVCLHTSVHFSANWKASPHCWITLQIPLTLPLALMLRYQLPKRQPDKVGHSLSHLFSPLFTNGLVYSVPRVPLYMEHREARSTTPSISVCCQVGLN